LKLHPKNPCSRVYELDFYLLQVRKDGKRYITLHTAEFHEASTTLHPIAARRAGEQRDRHRDRHSLERRHAIIMCYWSLHC